MDSGSSGVKDNVLKLRIPPSLKFWRTRESDLHFEALAKKGRIPAAISYLDKPAYDEEESFNESFI